MPPQFFSCFGKLIGGGHATRDSRRVTRDVVADEPAKESPVVVELFSSQGCAESAEAELLISRLGRGDFNLDVPVVVLAFHVDYWDYLGWKDPYASSLFTVRQKAYVEALQLDAIFTPQIVVNGASQCVGNDEAAMLSAIASASRFPSPTFKADFQMGTSDSLQVSLTGSLRTKIDSQGVNIMMAISQSGFITDCPEGKNKGRVLSNDYVVRKVEKLCNVKEAPAKKMISGTVTFPLWEGFNSRKCVLVLFVEDTCHRIIGAQNFTLPDAI